MGDFDRTLLRVQVQFHSSFSRVTRVHVLWNSHTSRTVGAGTLRHQRTRATRLIRQHFFATVCFDQQHATMLPQCAHHTKTRTDTHAHMHAHAHRHTRTHTRKHTRKHVGPTHVRLARNIMRTPDMHACRWQHTFQGGTSAAWQRGRPPCRAPAVQLRARLALHCAPRGSGGGLRHQRCRHRRGSAPLGRLGHRLRL